MPRVNRIIRIAAAGAVVVAAVAVLPASAAADNQAPALRRALAAVHAAGAPGAFAEVRDDGRIWTGATGIATLANARPMRSDLRHRVGSITKTFVATTVLQLVGEGHLGLDDPIGRLLPDLVSGEVGERVTVRMLLNHTSGIGNHTAAILNSIAGVLRAQTTSYPPEQLVRIGLELPRTGEPGAAYSYSNTNYLLAALLIERVTGNDAADEITRRIVRPLRLTDTYFPGDDPDIRGPHAGAYLAFLGVRDLSRYNMSWAGMAGELISTTEDLNDFFHALFAGRLLAAPQLEQMRTTVPFDPANPDLGGYGLGVYWVGTPCGRVWGHNGGVIGQYTESLHLPERSRQVSFAMNFSDYQITPELHPIDAAQQAFMLRALCPEAAASPTARSATPYHRPAESGPLLR